MREDLQARIVAYIDQGWRVASQTETNAQLIRAAHGSTGEGQVYIWIDAEGKIQERRTERASPTSNLGVAAAITILALLGIMTTVGLCTGQIHIR